MGVSNMEGLVEDLVGAVLVMLQQRQHALAKSLLDPNNGDGFRRAEQRGSDLIRPALIFAEDIGKAVIFLLVRCGNERWVVRT